MSSPPVSNTSSTKLTLLLTILLTTIFDQTISSQSILKFRALYDIAFILMSWFLFSIITSLFKNGYPNWRIKVTLPKWFYLIIVGANLLSLASMNKTEFIGVGTLNTMMFNQVMEALPPFIFYLGVLLLNAIIVLIVADPEEKIDFVKSPLVSLMVIQDEVFSTRKHRVGETDFVKLPPIVLLLISVETFSASWLFSLIGTSGLLIAVAIFHAAFSIASLYLWRRKPKNIVVSLTSSDFGLLIFSIGLIMMCFMPQGLYSQFSDTSAILDSEVSILLRGDIKPYYMSDNFYPAVGGFVCSIFQLSTGLRNLMLSSSLAFLTSYITLPFIVYYFLVSYITKDERVALIGAVFSVFADGLAVMFFPQYLGYFTLDTLHWVISPATESLQFSPIVWLWYSPYKILGLSSAIAVGLSPKFGRLAIIMGGAFVALAFINARQPTVAFMMLIYLLWVGVIDLKYALGAAASAFVFLGPLSGPIISNFSSIPLTVLRSLGILSTGTQALILSWGRELTQHLEYSYLLAFTGLCLALLLLWRGFNLKLDTSLIDLLSPRDSRWTLPASKLLLTLLLAGTILYSVFYAQLQSIQGDASILSGTLLLPLSIFVLRHPALTAMLVTSLIIYKYSVKLLSLVTVLLSLAYFTLIINHIVYTALIVALFALPTLEYLVVQRSKLPLILVSIFLIVGFFSGTAYASLVKLPESDPYEQDLPGAVNALLTFNSQEQIYVPSSYPYFADRIVQMANLRPTGSPSRVAVIDKNYITPDQLLKYLDNKFIMFNGSSILIVRTP
jgi:hypothetical protein